MQASVDGLHHVTAISGDAQGNHDFYVGGLGLRLVKKTVNFDAPDVYHLYYGDGTGSAGTIMTFFPFPGARKGRVGRGQVSITQFAVPPGSLGFWEERLPRFGARLLRRETVFGAERLVAEDPEGLRLAFVEVPEDGRMPWTGGDVGDESAIRGFLGVTLAVGRTDRTAAILTGIFGYEEAGTEGPATRFRRAGSAAGIVDVEADPEAPAGIEAAGTVHHVAFSVPDRAAQERVRAAVAAAGHRVTEQIDRDYFFSIYFRTPDGILFEVATEEPGFAVDEPVERLGEELRVPKQHAHLRQRIEAALPPLVA